MNAQQKKSAGTDSAGRSGVRPRYRWRVVDIVTAAILAVVVGVVFWAWGLAWAPLSVLLGVLPGFVGVLNGPWLIAGVLGALIIRKPGAAFFTELLAALVSALLGSQWGFTALISGALQGLGAEIIFAIFAYSQWRLWVAVLAGIGSSIALAVNDLVVFYPGADSLFQTIYLLTSMLSGAVIAGLGSWAIVQGLSRAGALRAFRR
jgi:energy-coupling factor transport system substrate-specific component